MKKQKKPRLKKIPSGIEYVVELILRSGGKDNRSNLYRSNYPDAVKAADANLPNYDRVRIFKTSYKLVKDLKHD